MNTILTQDKTAAVEGFNLCMVVNIPDVIKMGELLSKAGLENPFDLIGHLLGQLFPKDNVVGARLLLKLINCSLIEAELLVKPGFSFGPLNQSLFTWTTTNPQRAAERLLTELKIADTLLSFCKIYCRNDAEMAFIPFHPATTPAISFKNLAQLFDPYFKKQEEINERSYKLAELVNKFLSGEGGNGPNKPL